jgi:hypothetical protein
MGSTLDPPEPLDLLRADEPRSSERRALCSVKSINEERT